jgi:hypothetical protein
VGDPSRAGDLYDSRDKPHVVEHARKLGFLYGPYDSYHSIHSPDAHENDTWSTAQFDRNLYETGGVVGLDGKKRGGFKKRGYHLSPLAARPYVEKRLEGLMRLARYGAWFVDCDGCPESTVSWSVPKEPRRSWLRRSTSRTAS